MVWHGISFGINGINEAAVTGDTYINLVKTDTVKVSGVEIVLGSDTTISFTIDTAGLLPEAAIDTAIIGFAVVYHAKRLSGGPAWLETHLLFDSQSRYPQIFFSKP
jgi:hypothetical protein